MLRRIEDPQFVITSDEIVEGIQHLLDNIILRYPSGCTICGILVGALRLTYLLQSAIDTLPNGHLYPTCFLGARSYINDKQQEEVMFYGAPSVHLIHKRQVVLVDDVIDSGKTILAAAEWLKRNREARHIVAVALCIKGDKPHWLSEEAFAFQLPKDEFIVGFGMDYNGHYRDLDEIRPITAGEREAAAVPVRTEASGETPEDTRASTKQGVG